MKTFLISIYFDFSINVNLNITKSFRLQTKAYFSNLSLSLHLTQLKEMFTVLLNVLSPAKSFLMHHKYPVHHPDVI